MEEYIRAIGWKLDYPMSLDRMLYIANIFKEYYKDSNDISYEDIKQQVVYSIVAYGGEGSIYGIYVRLISKENYSVFIDNYTVDPKQVEQYRSFIKAFAEAIPDTAPNITPAHYIDYYIQYVYSLMLKGKFITEKV